MSIEQEIRQVIRDVKDFPKQGIVFKDITPILQKPRLVGAIVDQFVEKAKEDQVNVIVGVESRGFLFGMMVAEKLQVPFVPVRKEGKLPYKTIKHSYALEYGEATVEVHDDAIKAGDRVMIHDDLLATGGTAEAAACLVEKLGGEVADFTFLIELSFLNGRKKLTKHNQPIYSIVEY